MTAKISLRERRAQETRQLILHAARRLFARRGYGQTSIDQILEDAGISKGAFYHHFSGKEELLRVVLDDHVRRDQMALLTLPAASTLRELIERFVAYWLFHLSSDRESGQLFIEFYAQATRETWASEAIGRWFRQVRELVSGIIRIGQRAGAVRPGLDPEAAAMLLFAIFQGIAIQRAVDTRAVDIEKLMEPWVDLMDRWFITEEGGIDLEALREEVTTLLGHVAED